MPVTYPGKETEEKAKPWWQRKRQATGRTGTLGGAATWINQAARAVRRDVQIGRYRPELNRRSRAWAARYQAQADVYNRQRARQAETERWTGIAERGLPYMYPAGTGARGTRPGAQVLSPAEIYRQRGLEAFLQNVNRYRSAPGSTYTPTYWDIYQSAYMGQYPRYPSPMGPVMIWSNYAPGYTQPQTAEGQQAGYQPYSGYGGYYPSGRRPGGGGGGGGGYGGTAARAGYRPNNLQTPWYQAMIQWKI